MKKLIIICIAVLSMSNAFSQGIKFEHGTFAEALAKAKSENKMVFIDCYTSWCGPCKIMTRSIFPEKEVGDFFNANFVSVKMDMEKGEGIELTKKYEVNGFPTLLWLDGDGKVVYKSVGSTGVKELIELGKKAEEAKRDWSQLLEKYKSGERGVAFLQKYILAGIKNGYADKEAMEIYYVKKDEEELINPLDFEIFENTVTSIDNDKFKFVIANKEKYVNEVGSLRVNEFIKSPMMYAISMAMGTRDSLHFESVKKEVVKLDEMVGGEILAEMKVQMLGYVSHNTEYFTALVDYALKYKMDDAQILNQYAQYLMQKEEGLNKEILRKSLKMIQRSVELNVDFENTDTHALILYKIGDEKKARIVAAKAIELAPKMERTHLWSYKYLNKK